MQAILDWCRLACSRAVILRGLKFAVIVGAVLVGINHGDAILRGQLDEGRLVRIALTVVVPYVVSVLSSVGATRQLQRAASDPSSRPPPPRTAR